MENNLPQKRVDEILAYILSKKINDVQQLLINNGVLNAAQFDDQQLRVAFLKAVKDSQSFRDSLSAYMAALVQQKASENFVRQPGVDFVQQPSLPFLTTSLAAAAEAANNKTTTTATTTKTTTAQKSSFWSTLGGLASKENIQTLFNTGLNVAATSLTSKANKESEERALQLEAIRLQQIQAQKELAATEKKGLSAGAWIGIILGVAALATVVIIVVKKKK